MSSLDDAIRMAKPLPGIYRITNPKGAIYVGSSKNIRQRLRTYRYLTSKQPKLFYSFSKYGLAEHSFDVLEYVELPSLLAAEIRHGASLRVLDRDNLNLCLPHDGSKYCSFSQEAREKIGKAHRGKKLSPAHKLALSNATKGRKQSEQHISKRRLIGTANPMYGLRGAQVPFFGKKHTAESRAAMSEKRRGRGLLGENANAKPVLDTRTGKVYPSVKDAAHVLEINYSTLKAMLQGMNPNPTPLVMLPRP